MSSKQEGHTRDPNFSFATPRGYRVIIERGLIGYDEFGPLRPWYYLDRDSLFTVAEIWPKGPHKGHLVAFARRQDCDDIACFEVEGTSVTGIVVIHGWTPSGYDLVSHSKSFWEWLKSVIDDIAELVDVVVE